MQTNGDARKGAWQRKPLYHPPDDYEKVKDGRRDCEACSFVPTRSLATFKSAQVGKFSRKRAPRARNFISGECRVYDNTSQKINDQFSVKIIRNNGDTYYDINI